MSGNSGNKRFRRLAAFLPFLFFLVLTSILFAPFFMKGRVFLAADNLYIYYPWKAYVGSDFSPHNTLITDPINSSYFEIYNRNLKKAKLDNWSPYTLMGGPDVGGGRYYPLKLLLNAAFSTPVALTLSLCIHVFLMGCFMYLYLLEIGAGKRSALFGAVAYMFNGCAMVWLEFESWVIVSAYLPLILLCIERFLGQRKLLYAFGGGSVWGLLMLTEHYQLLIYIAIFMLFYMIFISIRYLMRTADMSHSVMPACPASLREKGLPQRGNDNHRPGNSEDPRECRGAWRGLFALWGCFAITMSLGLIIGAAGLIPFNELVSNSSRISRGFTFQSFFDTLARVPFRYFITLLFPKFFGSPILHINLIPALPTQEYMNYNELNMYMGVATVFAFAASLIAPKNVFSRFYIFMTVVIAAMMCGTYVYYPFFRWVPGMDKMNPTRLIFLFVFVFIVAAALGIRGIETMKSRRQYMYIGAALLVLFGASYVAFFGGTNDVIIWFNREFFRKMTGYQRYLLDRAEELRSISSPVILKQYLMICAMFCFMTIFTLFGNSRVRNLVLLLILSLLSYDLISFAAQYNTTVRPEYVYPKTPSINYLLAQKRPFRVAQDIGRDLYFNTLRPFGLEDVGGYASVYPEGANKLLSYVSFGDAALNGATLDRWVGFSDFSSKLLDLLNVRYVLTSPGHLIRDAKYRLVFSGDMEIYENMQVMPRAYAVHRCIIRQNPRFALDYMGSEAFDMKNEIVLESEPPADFLKGIEAPSYPPKVTIEKYAPDEVRMAADVSTNGWLVLSDNYYPGWKAVVDGRESRILRANFNFRAVELTAGKHDVIFTYKPRSVNLGRMLTLTGSALAISGLVLFGVFVKR